MPYKILHTLYCALAESTIRYGIQVWGNTYNSCINRLFKIQTKIIKIIIPHFAKISLKTNNDLYNYCITLSQKVCIIIV